LSFFLSFYFSCLPWNRHSITDLKCFLFSKEKNTNKNLKYNKFNILTNKKNIYINLNMKWYFNIKGDNKVKTII